MSVKVKSIYEYFADTLHYPDEGLQTSVEAAIEALSHCTQYPPEVMEDMKHFLAELEKLSLDDIQGIYSYTFELTSEYTLDLGHFLYDGFKRSNNLASLKAMYRENGFPYDEVAKGELPDHLPVVLAFLGRLENAELKQDVTSSFLVMALEKLDKNFERNKGNLYSHLISAIHRVVDKDVKGGK
ncbi:MAG: nitrate reductase molybdenum cofactor assembly chaperone [Thermodesulfobacteriota bacterium]